MFTSAAHVSRTKDAITGGVITEGGQKNGMCEQVIPVQAGEMFYLL